MSVKVSVKKILARLMNTPMVIEYGTSGIWTYRKWSDGIAECWGVYTYTSTASTVWMAPLYYSDETPQISYPFTFIERPLEFVSLDSTTNAVWLYKESGVTNTTTHTAKYRPIKVSTFSSNTFDLRFHIIGKWGTIDPTTQTMTVSTFSQDQMSKQEIQDLIEASGNQFKDNNFWIPSNLA